MTNNIFIHSTCGNPLLLNLNNSIQFLGIPVIVEGSVQISTIILKSINIKPLLYCYTCKEDIPSNEILICCSQCKKPSRLYNDKDKLNDLYIAPFGGIVCKNCVDQFNLENVTKLEKLTLETK
jgi:hypothetical protein